MTLAVLVIPVQLVLMPLDLQLALVLEPEILLPVHLLPILLAGLMLLVLVPQLLARRVLRRQRGVLLARRMLGCRARGEAAPERVEVALEFGLRRARGGGERRRGLERGGHGGMGGRM
jgi:hypothetical protein